MSLVTCANEESQKTRNDAKNHVKTYIRMSLHDRHPPRPMRFLRHQPQKVLRILWGSRIHERISFPFSSSECSSRRPSFKGWLTLREGLCTSKEAEIWSEYIRIFQNEKIVSIYRSTWGYRGEKYYSLASCQGAKNKSFDC